MIQRRIDFEGLEWNNPIEGVRDKSLVQEGLRVRLVEYTKTMPLHWCEKGHFGYLLEGEMEIEYEKEIIVYRKGEGIFIPSGSEHKHRARVLSEKVLAFFVEDV